MRRQQLQQQHQQQQHQRRQQHQQQQQQQKQHQRRQQQLTPAEQDQASDIATFEMVFTDDDVDGDVDGGDSVINFDRKMESQQLHQL